jgi:chemotaxis signal transduction protein
VDLRYKFGLPVSEATVDTSIIVLEVGQEGETVRIGTIADTVEEVVEIAPEQIEPTPKIGTKLDTDFIEGIGKIHENFYYRRHWSNCRARGRVICLRAGSTSSGEKQTQRSA